MATIAHNDGSAEYVQTPKPRTLYRVFLAGQASSFESDDELVAAEYARLSKAQGWKSVSVREVVL